MRPWRMRQYVVTPRSWRPASTTTTTPIQPVSPAPVDGSVRGTEELRNGDMIAAQTGDHDDQVDGGEANQHVSRTMKKLLKLRTQRLDRSGKGNQM